MWITFVADLFDKSTRLCCNTYMFLDILEHYNLFCHKSISKNIVIKCPFHDDRNPSCYIDLENELFNCFVCDTKGDKKAFVAKLEPELSSLQVLKKIYEIENKSEITYKISSTHKTKLELKKQAYIYYKSLPKTDWNNFPKDDYIFERGFSPNTLIDNKVKININNDYKYIIPLQNQGKFIGYVTRQDANNENPNKSRYRYNKGFEGKINYHGNILSNNPIIVEGIFDYLKLKQFGINNCICIFSWRMSTEQANLIKKYTNRVISGLDDTDTGEQGFELIKAHKFVTQKFPIPLSCKDIGDMDEHEYNLITKDIKKLLTTN